MAIWTVLEGKYQVLGVSQTCPKTSRPDPQKLTTPHQGNSQMPHGLALKKRPGLIGLTFETYTHKQTCT